MSEPRNPGRAIPDAVDLNLLHEIVQTGFIGLPQIAWNTRLTQAEAASRLVEMAEHGLPLRLVAQGDQALLWQLCQRGPATGGVRALEQPGAAVSSAAAATDIDPSSVTMLTQGPLGRPVGPVRPAAEGPAGPAAPASAGGHRAPQVASAAALPPHEQAIAGAVPLGQPPFGGLTPDPVRIPIPDGAAINDPQPADPAAIWGTSGSAGWVRPDNTMPTDPAVIDAAAPPSVEWDTFTVEGLGGEHLRVSLLEFVDPADEVLAAAGFHLEATERAVLVRTRIDNDGPTPHLSLPDGYLMLVDNVGGTCTKAPVSLPNRPAHRLGIAPDEASEGWTIFLIDRDRQLTGVRWCVRPDLVDRTATWPITPLAS